MQAWRTLLGSDCETERRTGGSAAVNSKYCSIRSVALVWWWRILSELIILKYFTNQTIGHPSTLPYIPLLCLRLRDQHLPQVKHRIQLRSLLP